VIQLGQRRHLARGDARQDLGQGQRIVGAAGRRHELAADVQVLRGQRGRRAQQVACADRLREATAQQAAARRSAATRTGTEKGRVDAEESQVASSATPGPPCCSRRSVTRTKSDSSSGASSDASRSTAMPSLGWSRNSMSNARAR
jgi:hypothetical protein